MQFCKSWWGNRYIETIEDMDQARMKRGRRYARNGSVLSIKINKNKVAAKVQGSSFRRYTVQLEFIPFSEAEKQIIIEAIKESPLLIASLLSGNMPKELEAVMNEKSVNLFISDWDDMMPHCSCPDWAVPCKHLAAVMYQIALEIDRNPFTIFDLHNFDIIGELKNIGLSLEKDNIYEIRDITKTSSPSNLSKPNKHYRKYTELADSVDFSKIPALKKKLFSLLSDIPPSGINKNFKKQLEKFYKMISKSADKRINSVEQSEYDTAPQEEFDVLYCLKDMTPFYYKSTGTNLILNTRPDELIKYLCSIPAGSLKNYSPKTVFWWLIYHFSLIIAKQGAFSPELVYLGYGDLYRIRWRAALQSEEVNEIFNIIISILPDGLFMIEKEKTALEIINKTVQANAVKIRVRRSDSKKKVLSAKKINDDMLKLQKMILAEKSLTYSSANFNMIKTNAAFATNEIIACFVDHFISTEKDFMPCHLKGKNSEEVNSLFFEGQPVCFSDFDKKSLPSAISLWLSRLHLSAGDINPVIEVEESKHEVFKFSLTGQIEKNIFRKPVPFSKIIRNKEFESYRAGFVRKAGFISEFLPEMKDYINCGGKRKITKSLSQTGEILHNIIPLIKLTGIKVKLPRALKNILKPKLTISLESGVKDKIISYLSLDEMLSFDYRISIGDTNLKPEQFRNLVKNVSGLVKIRGNYVFCDSSEIEKLLTESRKHRASINEIFAAGISGEYDGAPVLISEEARKVFKKILEIKSVPVPKGIRASLRPYQHRGFEWLYKNAKLGMGSLLADDMGLGKTIQAIVLIQKMKEESKNDTFKALVIVPTTLLSNWKREIEKFAPNLSIQVYHGPQRKKAGINQPVIITTYGVLRSDVKLFVKKEFSVIITDEAQNIKNPSAAQTKAVKSVKAAVKISLTGTPVENRLTEYWSIFDFTNKGYLGSLDHFRKNIVIPVEAYKDSSVIGHFRKITSPFIMRRMKTDKNIISDLPDKIESDRYCGMKNEQAALYQSVVNDILAQIENSEGIERKGLIFKLMTSLKQICNHPAHFLKKKDIDPGLSGKSEALLDLLSNILENNEKALIFTQYYEMGSLLVKMISEKTGHSPFFLHGSLSRKKRDEMVQSFQKDRASKLFILSLKAGGTGLNLTKASHVIHYDLWWNPAVESQATDRAYRIGQTKNVIVSRLITEGTFEERINDMIKSKKKLASNTVTAGENWIGDMTDNELEKLFKL